MKNFYKKMHIYKLLRTEKQDKNGRPAIFLSYFGKQSLIWYGTSNYKINSKDKPIILNLDLSRTYFYNSGLEKINTSELIGRWKDNSTQKIKMLSLNEQRALISKFSNMTNDLDPYQKITLLELENEVLKKENEVLVEENQHLLN